MKAITITGTGGPEVLHIRETPTPEPRGDQVRVRVRACGLNRADLPPLLEFIQHRWSILPITFGSGVRKSLSALLDPWEGQNRGLKPDKNHRPPVTVSSAVRVLGSKTQASVIRR
jgi:hypothetical protein